MSALSMAPSEPLLSVILPVFNTGRYVRSAIDSILQQTFSDFELLIVDDGSSDDSLRVIREFTDERIRVFPRPRNSGKVAACNGVLSHCRGKYLTIHDSDDISERSRFEKQIRFLERNPQYAMCGTQFFEINRHGQIAGKVALETNPDQIRQLIKIDSQFHGPTMIFRSSVVSEIGGLYRDFRNKEDVDLSMRIAEKYLVINLDEYLYYYRLIPEGLSKVNFDFLRFEGLKVLHALAEQRRTEGADCLMKGDLVAYESLLSAIRKPYLDDPALLYRKGVSLSVYFKFWKNAFRYAVKAIIADPAGWINYREFLYVLKRSIFHLVLKNRQ